MSFWKAAGDLAKKAGSATLDGAKSVNEANNKCKAEMKEMDEDELVRIVKTRGQILRYTAAYAELKSRGLDDDDIKLLIK